MTEEEKRELNKKIAEWLRPPPLYRVSEVHLPLYDRDRGRIGIEVQYTQEAKDYINSQEKGLGDIKEVGEYYFWEWLPVLTRSFDACFEWLVPKLKKLGLDIGLHDTRMRQKDEWWFEINKGNDALSFGINEEPALAFCLAVEKMIDSRRKENGNG